MILASWHDIGSSATRWSSFGLATFGTQKPDFAPEELSFRELGGVSGASEKLLCEVPSSHHDDWLALVWHDVVAAESGLFPLSCSCPQGEDSDMVEDVVRGSRTSSSLTAADSKGVCVKCVCVCV
jgi:hypothetical protein